MLRHVEQRAGGMIPRQSGLGKGHAPQNARQQIVEVVRDAAGENSDALQFVSLQQRRFGLAELADVVYDFPELTIVSFSQRSHGAVGKEAGTVFTDPPAFIFGPPPGSL